MIKTIPGLKKKIMVVLAVILFLVTTMFFTTPSKIHAGIGFDFTGTSFTEAASLIVINPSGITYDAGQCTVFLPYGTVITRPD
jgi:hypothetical protein